MNEPRPNAFDEVLYPSAALVQTHPDRLATIATLMGIQPTPVARCRVLELGCGDGANLLPMAFGLPRSEFVGIDLAAKPIAEGQVAAQALGLHNLRLEQADLLDFTPAWGQFDYIIAHGLYAWVPRVVQDKLLAVCCDNLAPHGVAYVSYNTYPGSHLRDMLREMMLFHLRELTSPTGRIQEAKALARFLAIPRAKPDPYQNFMIAEAEQIIEHAGGHLYHDELAETFCPAYFHQFIAHATEHRLQYLAEADYYEMQDHIYPPEIIEELDRVAPTRLLREQYLDFLKCRRFRQTLLCHANLSVKTNPSPEIVRQFWISSQARPASAQPELTSRKMERFTGKKGAGMETDHPLTKAAMFTLGQSWPHRLVIDELLNQARSVLGCASEAARGPGADDAGTLCETLLQAHGAGLVEFHLHAPASATQPGGHPTASALARYQIQHGDVVTNLYHQPVQVEGAMAKALLLLLDGTRDRAALNAAMAAELQGSAASSRPPDLQLVAGQLDKQLAKLARLGLLVA